MPFARPTLTELRNQAANDINGALDGVDALLRFSNLGIIGDVAAELANGHYGYLDWIARQSNPFTATDEYAEAWAALKNVIRKPATGAIGFASFPSGTGDIVPADSTVTRSDGFTYVTTADATGASGTVTVPIAATVAGAAGNAADGATMTLGVGIAGISGTGAADGPLTGGADIEPFAEFRSRYLAKYAAPPQGGSIADYAEWALEVPGVTRLWVVPSGQGPGSVVLLFMMDDAEAAFGGFPQGTNGCATLEVRDTAATGDQLALANAIFLKQPVTAVVYAVAPIPNTINLTIAGIAGASSTTKGYIAAAVTAVFRATGQPGGVTDILPVEAAISSVPGTGGAVLTGITCSAGSVTPGTAGNITSDAGALPVLGTITYT